MIQLVLQEKVLGDRETYAKCMAHVWQARALKEKNPEHAELAYAAALEAQPFNFPVWIESVDFLKDSREPTAESWEIIRKAVSTALAAYPESAWEVLARIQEPAMKALAADRREAFFLKHHEMIAKQDGPVMWAYDKALDAQAKALGEDPVRALGFFEKVLGIQSTSKLWFAPNAVVRLGKLGDVSGIVILGTDYGQNSHRQMPLKVSVSEDGGTWTEVFRTTDPVGPWRIPLSGKATRVLYVKAERDDDRNEFFHLAGIRVYGRKLQ